MAIRPLDDRTYSARSAYSLIWGFGEAVRLFMASLHNSQCVLKCALLTFSSISSRPAEVCKRDFSTPGLGLGDVGSGIGHLVVHPWVPFSSRLTHMIYLLSFVSYLTGPKSASDRPSDPDMITITALEALAQFLVAEITTDQQLFYTPPV